jgi:AraC-like DNA-binding protein
MKAQQSRTRIWRSHYLPSIELLHNVGQSSHLLPRHFHEELELNIKQGDGWQFNYRGTTHNVPSDTLVVTQPGEAHQADSTGDSSGKSLRQQDYIFRGLRIDLDLLQQVATEVAGRETEVPLFPMPLVHDGDFNTQFVRVHQAIQRSTSQLEQQTLALDLLAQLILRYSENPPDLAKLETEIQPVHHVRDYLEDNYNREISLEELSRVANLSSFHLNRSFSKTFGMPPHAYQIQLRIIRAKRLLRQKKSIESVAIETGFVSQSHFGSHFKRLVCITPKQYIQDSNNAIGFGV